MKVLYAGLAVVVIALSGCSEQEFADFFKFQSEAELDRQAQNETDIRRQIAAGQECLSTELNTRYVIACSPHSSARNDESGRSSNSIGSATAFSDLRLKRDVVRVGMLPNGIPLYAFNYIWGGPRYIGVVAQDVLKVMPAAVSVDEYGYYRVDYSMIGTRMVLAEDQPRALFAYSSAFREQSSVASH